MPATDPKAQEASLHMFVGCLKHMMVMAMHDSRVDAQSGCRIAGNESGPA